MNKFTIQKLELDKIISMLVKECSSSLGRELVNNLEPIADYETLIIWQKETTEGVNIRRFEPIIPLGGIIDIKNLIRKAKIGGILEPEEFLKIYDTLLASRKLKKFLGERKKQYSTPRMQWWAEQLTVLTDVEQEIQNTIANDGKVLDNASIALNQIRKKIVTLQNRIKEKLDNLVRSERSQKYLQEAIVTIRDERYVVPVKQEYRNKIPGIVHDQSSSGATLFIEPMSILSLNNDLKKYSLEEKEEITKILKELTEKINEYVEELETNQEVLAHIDFTFAKARFSEKINAIEPKIVTEKQISIIKGRHPLISKDEVVPLTITLGEEFDLLVITGPNTGGKTVTLKTVGLFVLMAQCGLHIPADNGSVIGIFPKIYADIGDEQSIEQSLSTFSSHMTNIINILEKADEDSLIFFDELGAGTDPSEGAALAISILETILKSRARSIATTHYSELKTFAFKEERVQNASVEFDIKTLRPTYRLLIGVPGKSNAFDIAQKLGLPQYIVDKGRKLISENEKDAAKLIQSLEINKLQSELNTKESEEKLQEIKSKLAQIEEEQLTIKTKEEDIVRKAEEKALEIIKEARKESEAIIKEIRSVAKEEFLKADNKAIELKKRLESKENNLTGNMLKGPKVAGKILKKLEIGDEVFVPKINQRAIVASLPNSNDELQVQVGVMKVNVKINELTAATKRAKADKTGIGKMMIDKSKTIKTELDFRGTRVEEALDLVDKYLDDAYLVGLAQVSLIHGKGEGILRNTIRDMLKMHPHVKTYRTGGFKEGGEGVTIVEFKK
ncbi:DNA mismatch repair protein MutS2 [Desulfonispora thiosulfatigenes DSM 11270]|uniref:Endonuclease MutS2 n=1 Tax=Desulfonispora thiosulfatigenes DSM 11270 TaxID=656914 RepID=A0A1W1VRS8_DESTI|nr:endonuclease MutS2 [Desulfonispora thiosulfatigenes]SMB95963.1 DNA mismatch repair protein MutS2 [Desulfonispora thiosulfatigenes DSM 11270]